MNINEMEYSGHLVDALEVSDHIEMDIRPVVGGFALIMCYDAWDGSPLVPLWTLRQVIASKAKALEVMENVLIKREINPDLWIQG